MTKRLFSETVMWSLLGVFLVNWFLVVVFIAGRAPMSWIIAALVSIPILLAALWWVREVNNDSQWKRLEQGLPAPGAQQNRYVRASVPASSSRDDD